MGTWLHFSHCFHGWTLTNHVTEYWPMFTKTSNIPKQRATFPELHAGFEHYTQGVFRFTRHVLIYLGTEVVLCTACVLICLGSSHLINCLVPECWLNGNFPGKWEHLCSFSEEVAVFGRKLVNTRSHGWSRSIHENSDKNGPSSHLTWKFLFNQPSCTTETLASCLKGKEAC